MGGRRGGVAALDCVGCVIDRLAEIAAVLLHLLVELLLLLQVVDVAGQPLSEFLIHALLTQQIAGFIRRHRRRIIAGIQQAFDGGVVHAQFAQRLPHLLQTFRRREIRLRTGLLDVLGEFAQRLGGCLALSLVVLFVRFVEQLLQLLARCAKVTALDRFGEFLRGHGRVGRGLGIDAVEATLHLPRGVEFALRLLREPVGEVVDVGGRLLARRLEVLGLLRRV